MVVNEIMERLKAVRHYYSGSRCINREDEYGNMRAELILKANVLFKVNIPEYIRYYPYRLENIYYILESGEVFRKYYLDTGESACEKLTIDGLLMDVREAIEKGKRIEILG